MVQDETKSGIEGRRRAWPWVLTAAVVVLALLALGTLLVVRLVGPASGSAGAGGTFWEEEHVSGEGEGKIAVLPVSGMISSAPSAGGLLSGPSPTPDALRSQLDQAAEDERIRAVVVEVDSPGGSVVASDEMHGAIRDFKRETGKPVVVSMRETAASGGYWISTAADEVVAHPATLTGSIGVILPLVNAQEAEKKLGVRTEVIKSGEFKDIGSSSRRITPEEREILQDLIDENYDQFVKVIVEGRDMPEGEVRRIADGRIYTGSQAESLGLVDLEEAAEASRRLAKIDEAEVVRYGKMPGLFESLQARLAPGEPEALKVLEAVGIDPTPEVQALYRPGL